LDEEEEVSSEVKNELSDLTKVKNMYEHCNVFNGY